MKGTSVQETSAATTAPAMNAAAGNTQQPSGELQPQSPQSRQPTRSDSTLTTDPLDLGRHRRENISKRQLKIDHPKGNKRKLKKYYTQQNELIDQFLGADDEEANQVEEDARYRPKIKFAVNASFVVNFCLFIIQLYAAVSTGSLSVSSANASPLRAA